MTGGPGKEHRINKLHQPEEFGKGQKETPHFRPPPRILSLASILAGKGMHHQEGVWVRMIG